MLNLNVENQENPTPKDILIGIIERQDEEALYGWIVYYFHTEIPRVKICPDHDSPWDFVRDYIFGLHDFIIVLANRSGGKTYDFGILDTIMSFVEDKVEIATVGAIKYQAQKGYEYFKDFSMSHPFAHNILTRTMGKTVAKNESIVQVLTGTFSGVNSPHPQLVFLDEIDLMAWQVMQQALSMPQSKDNIMARTVLTSTRKFANGTMQRMITEAPKKGHKVYKWCIWEVVKPLPVENKELLGKIKKTFGEALPPRIDKANGYYFWEDLLTKYTTLDDETWETEWLCKRPGLEGVIYASSYSDEENMIMNTPNLGSGYVYIFEDFGHGEGHPDVVLFVWIPLSFDRLVVFDELYMTGLGTDDIWRETDNLAQKYGLRLPNKEEGITGNITGWVPDPHGLTEIEDRRYRGAPMMEKNKDASLYIVLNGIPLVKKFLQSGRLMLTQNCINLRMELLSYRKMKNRDGTYSQLPQKKDDHGPDALRYGIIALKEQLWGNAFGVEEPEKPEKEMSLQEMARLRAKQQSQLAASGDKTITAGMMEKKW